MKLTEARTRVLKRLSETNEPILLGGADIHAARYLQAHGLVTYHGLSHFSIMPAGRAALREGGE